MPRDVGVRLLGFFSGISVSCGWYYFQLVMPQNAAYNQNVSRLDELNQRVKHQWGKIHTEAVSVLRAPPRLTAFEEQQRHGGAADIPAVATVAAPTKSNPPYPISSSVAAHHTSTPVGQAA